MKKLVEIAADVMDLYNQDFLDDNESFFDLEFFTRQCEDVYSALLDEEYIQAYAYLRAEGRHKTEFVTVDPLWLTHETIEIKKDGETGYWKGEISGKVYSFKFDQSSCGLQNVAPAKRGACVFIRGKQEHEFMDQFMPPSKVVIYWPFDKAIRFDSGCCDKAVVMYVASPHGQLEVQEGKAEVIKLRVLDMMFKAKNGGQPVNESNDSSKNISPEELNKEVIK